MPVRRSDCHPDRPYKASGLCGNCYQKWLRETNPEYAARQRKNNADWLAANSERMDLYRRAYRQRPGYADQKALSNRRRRLAKFGLTLEDEKRILAEQQNGCAVCGSQPYRPFFDL